jgi:hypothetical protein
MESTTRGESTTVRFFEQLYAIVVGLGLAVAVEQVLDLGSGNVSVRLAHLPVFLAYINLAFPLAHASVRYLELAYVDRSVGRLGKGRVIADLMLGTGHFLWLITLSFLIQRPGGFVWVAIVLLVGRPWRDLLVYIAGGRPLEFDRTVARVHLLAIAVFLCVVVASVFTAGTTELWILRLGALACSLLTQNLWMRAQSELEWRLDTAMVPTSSRSDPNALVETLDVTFVQSSQPAEALDSVAEVEAELVVRGFDDPDKRYLTYVASGDDAGICGDAWYPLTHHVSEVDGQYAQVYLDSSVGCGARDFGTPATGGGLSEAIAQQELVHNDGMTPIGAPHTCANAGLPFGHLCTGPLWVLPSVDPEGRDVMFPYVYYPLRDKVLDRDNDDYFGHGLPLAALENSPYLQPANAWGDPMVKPRRRSSPQRSVPL